jgi:uncharacterized protein YndB with AHSA1/START domain
MPFDYEFRMRIQAPRPTVFERLLRIEHLSRWFCGWSRIEPKVGGTFRFGGETCIFLPEGRGWETTIDEGEVLRRFAFTWPIRGSSTLVSHELDDGPGDTTLLQIRHGGVPLSMSTCGSVQDAWRMCLGNLKSISEGRGDSVRPDHSPVTSPEVQLSVLIESTRPKVFDAFVDPAAVAHWSTGGIPTAAAHVEPQVGGAFSFGAKEGPDRVREWDAGRRIVLGWSHGASDRSIRFDFEEKSSGTAVYLTTIGSSDNPQGEVLRRRGHWSDRLVCLKNFVESGESGFLNRYEEQVRGD